MRRLLAAAGLALATIAWPLAGPAAAAGDSEAEPVVVRLAPGIHPGPIAIEQPTVLVGGPGVVVQAPAGGPAIVVRDTSGVTIRDLTLRGGSDGLVVRSAGEVVVEGLRVEGADLHGVLAHDAQLRLVGCHVSGMRSPMGQGVEIINSDHRPASVVRGCTIEGPVYEGISAHVTRVVFSGNEVVGSTERGIVITEMSAGYAAHNVVRDAAGAAFWCGDMSHCTLVDNRAERVRSAGDGWRSSQGHGIVVHSHSEALVDGFGARHLAGDAVVAMIDSRLVSGGPSTAGRDAAVAMATFAAVLIVAPAAFRRLGGVSLATAMLLTAVAVQVGHQAEHVAQVVQAKVLGEAAAHGLAGTVLDNEWVHLGFNSALLAALAIAGTAYLRGARPLRPGARWLVAALVVQGYHQVEHVTKVAQHVASGATPAPGLLGNGLDLVWLHFWLNAVVTALVFAAFAGLEGRALVARLRAGRPSAGPRAALTANVR